MRYIFDTDTLSELMKPRPRTSVRKRMAEVPREHRFISAASVWELRFGTALTDDPGKAWADVERVLLSRVEILPFERETAEWAGDLTADMRKAGVQVDEPDLMIGATARQHDLTVVTRNERHFSLIPGVRFENWFD